MDFDLNEEHIEFRAVVRDFAENEIEPHAEQWDRDHYFPVDTVKQMGDLGLFGLVFPEKYGGADAEFITLCIAIEELARIDSSMAITLSAGVGLGAMPIFAFGNDEQRDQWLPDLVAGRKLGAFGLTEPDAGSDAGATRSTAVLNGDDWVVNGTKAFITNSGNELTSIITVTARSENGISAFVIPSGTPGLEVEPPYRKMGWHASDTHGLVLVDCKVPQANLLGSEGRGFNQFLATLDDGRIAIAALAVGLAQACLEHSVEYAKTRNAFGGPIGKNQAVSFALADLATQLDAARLLTYRAAWLKDQGRPFKQEAAIAKLHATESAVVATRVATQVFGGYGFIDETPVSRFYRDAKILEVGEGTSEIQRLVISRGLGLPVT